MQAYLFSPRDAMEQFRAEQRAKRRTKVQPSQQYRRKQKPRKQPGESYSANAYGCAVAKACVKAKVPHFHPHQIRHTHATEVRRASVWKPHKWRLATVRRRLPNCTPNATSIWRRRWRKNSVDAPGPVLHRGGRPVRGCGAGVGHG